MIKKNRADLQKAFKALEDAIESKEHEIKDRLHHPQIVNNLVSSSMEAVNDSIVRLDQIVTGGLALTQLAVRRAEHEIRRNPPLFLGKVALCGFGLGLILGSRMRNSRSRGRR